ncbi:MAG: hypothetical protein J5671_00720 [Bacteroidaceae bacterium]|nr:hypothetical protein [Bacteroidaceae bacterium]
MDGNVTAGHNLVVSHGGTVWFTITDSMIRRRQTHWMQHLTYHKGVQDGASNEWQEAVTDELYNQLR